MSENTNRFRFFDFIKFILISTNTQYFIKNRDSKALDEVWIKGFIKIEQNKKLICLYYKASLFEFNINFGEYGFDCAIKMSPVSPVF